MDDPLAQYQEMTQEGIDIVARFQKGLIKDFEEIDRALELLRSPPDVKVGQTPCEVIWEGDIADLVRYEGKDDEEKKPPLLLVYALINEPYILDLQPGRSVVESLLNSGLDVYMIDWKKPEKKYQFETMDGYVNHYIDLCVDKVRKIRNREAINILGYCMGGTLSAIYASLHPEKVQSLTLMAAGLDFENDPGLLKKWAEPEYFDPEKVVEAFGTCPGDMLDFSYSALSPVDNTVGKLLSLADNADDEKFVEMFFRMEKWIHDSKDIPGPTFSKFVKDLYQQNKLMDNKLMVGNELVDLNDLNMPILTLVGEYDTLVPPESSLSFNDAVASEKTELMKAPVGHIGLSVSSKVHPDLWKDVARWIKDNDIESLESIKWIGKKSASKLREASVKDVKDLKSADTEELAKKTGISEKRIKKWKERA